MARRPSDGDGDPLRLSPQPTSPSLDVMNDPAFDPSRRRKDKGLDENDTCRICRGEGSDTEPLFYPCKCSGSIKFVHQDCLMEWLSHSQKKHCELCKTSFRFTKLYHPQMPSKLPLLVFAKQGTIHVFKSLVTWTRWNLVILVWLGWVPWSMRMVWRSLFYIGDGGWITPQEIERRFSAELLAQSSKPGTSPAQGSLVMPATTPAGRSTTSVGAMLLNTWNTKLYSNSDQPVMLRFWERIFRVALYPLPDIASAATNATNNAIGTDRYRSPSVLSGYQVLNNLTRSSAINNLAIDVIEGQLITLLVVIGFILVFLIREWVVQQQPVVNGGFIAEPEPEAAELEADLDAGGEDNQVLADTPTAMEQNDEESPVMIDPSLVTDDLADTWEQMSSNGQPSNRSGEALDQGNQELDHDATSTEPIAHVEHHTVNSWSAEQSNSFGQARPSLPHRGALGPASEIRRTLEEEALVSGQTWPGVDVFMDLWRQAESDPEEVLRIIRADGRETELSWIVSAMARLQNGLPTNSTSRPVGTSTGAVDSSGRQTPDSSWLIFDDRALNQDPFLDETSKCTSDFSTPSPDSGTHLDLTDLHRARVERSSQAPRSDTASMPAQSITASLGPAQDHSGLAASNDAVSQENSELTQPVESIPSLAQDSAADTDGTMRGPAVPPKTLGDALQDWLWGDIPVVEVPVEDDGEDDEHIVENLADEAPFVPVANGQVMIDNLDEEQNERQDPEVLQAAAEAGILANDAEGVEDGEDLEGILELIGAQGPLIGLIQNGLFSALLIAISFITGVWVPYITGKVVLVFAANPISLLIKMPLRWTSALADWLVDSVIFLVGGAFYVVDACVRVTATPIGWAVPFVRHASQDRLIGKTAYKHTLKSANRLAQSFVTTADVFSESDIPLFSMVAHESLVTAKSKLYRALLSVVSGIEVFTTSIKNNAFDAQNATKILGLSTSWSKNLLSQWIDSIESARSRISFHSLSLRVKFDTPQRISPLDFRLVHWSTQDRVIAIIIGYAFFLLAGSAYLKLYSRSKDEQGERARGTVIDILQQAGGVTKVILIISIEMIVFPLYCGALLDIALLPLFKDATISSRLIFTLNAPLTSTFIHWFIGTCYMFHFALFVSMCRRILRTGVLYFIRDPDDPSFHPVRDVLERNVSTQLRKIAFSALVYGGLVIVCLGAVVWGIGRVTGGIFPIRWMSSTPVLESPVDLLVYNFVMPFAIAFTEPATVLHVVYKWWFRKCARWLRLTHFLFGERIEDEMYIFVRDPFKHIRLKDVTPPAEYLEEERRLLQSREIASYYLNGYFVRAPASDQVRLPKGTKTFVPVDELGNRVDGLPDSDQGLHGRNNRLFKKIFIPRRFGVRITAFLALIWIFAGVTGVGSTMIPLLFGRWLFGRFCPPEFLVNDIYAFAVGAYILGVPLYLAVRFYPSLRSSATRLAEGPLVSHASLTAFYPVLQRAAGAMMRVLRLVYFYGTLGLILPTLTGLIWEMYVVIPLLTLSHTNLTPPYTIRFVQAWTLAVVALKFATKVLLERPETAPARALRALVSPGNRGAGWADPDVRLATRAIIIPCLVVLTLALTFPPVLAAGILRLVAPTNEAIRPLVFRYTYPAVLGVGLSILIGHGLGRGLQTWRERVRDEVFLVGERLHNFGERSAGPHQSRPRIEQRSSQRVEIE